MFLNIAAYKFVDLGDLPPLRDELLDQCQLRQLKGTILISPEGINLFLAGEEAAIDSMLQWLRSKPPLDDLQAKRSFSTTLPFDRLRVRIKKEIIAFDVPGIDPAQQQAKRISAANLKSWLDEHRSFTLLDTRNNYEVGVGTFDTAVHLDIDDFRAFPGRAATLPDSLKQRPVVTFCTGGIRCEKAAPLLEKLGFTEVYQLDGGILRYFEDVGNAHFSGPCWVFDQRVAIDSQLRETNLKQCQKCDSIWQSDTPGDHTFCPHCQQK